MNDDPFIAVVWFIIRTADRKADSTGRRNTGIILSHKELVEGFGRCFPTERFARSCVNRMRYGIQFFGRVPAEIRALWKDCRSKPLVFSFEPRCHGLWGSQK